MEMILKVKFHPIERGFISLSLIFLVFGSHFQRGNGSQLPSSRKFQTFELSTGESESNIHVTVMGTEIEYEVFEKYDFFIPDVDVVCQCGCTDSDTLRSCSFDHECANLANLTTTCSIHIIIDTDNTFCSKFYKLCCQVYFTKTELMRPFRALFLKHRETIVNLKIISKSQSGKADAVDVTVKKSGKRILVNPDKVLHIPEFSPVRHIPETWYFIEDGSDELQYSDAMNGIDERDLNKIGWFQYSVRHRRLSRVGLQDLKRHLYVKMLNCHSKPPKYEWKLNATYYVSKELMHFPLNVKKISKMYKDISKISVDLKEEKIKVVTTNSPVTNISVSRADLYPFIFTSSIKNGYLNLRWTKGRGSFNVEITIPHWSKTLSLPAESREKIIQLPNKHYDSCWVCVSQNNQQLCQVPALIKYDGGSMLTSNTEGLNNVSHVNATNENVTDSSVNTSISSSDNPFKTAVIVTIIVSSLVIVTSLPVIFILRRRRQRKLKDDVCDEMEMEPLSSNNNSRRPRTILTKNCCWKGSSRIQVKIEEEQRQRYQRIQLPQVSWMERILPLEELYVTLKLMKTVDEYEDSRGEPMRVEELFSLVDGKRPVRILVEGGPGYGKTTLCLKLLNDFGRRRDYICRRFKMIFMFQLRLCEESASVEEMLRRECEAVGVGGDEGIRCIEAFQSETLLLLDGFDEISEEGKRMFLPLFCKEKYPSMFVMVTSRRGTFQEEKKNTNQHRGFCEMVSDDVNAKEVWSKRVLIKGVTKDKVETFLKKYLEKDYEELKRIIDPIIGGEMREVFECPLFLILLAMMLEEKKMENVDSKTTLFKEFFNFIVRRNLIREKKLSKEEDVDIFSESFGHSVVHSLQQFGRLSVEYLCDNKLTFEENTILENCKDENILKLGFLTKNTNMEGHKKNDFYQPIHKSFLEFLAAFATWRLFKTDEDEFKREMERVGEKGLTPTNDSLFHVFLGGFMNTLSHVLFQTLTVYRLWFNIESLCFTNILSEIQDIRSFFPSFQPILDSFIPSHYQIHGVKGLTREYFQSKIHSLILKYSSDRKLINLLRWNSLFSINLSDELYFDSIELMLTNNISTISSNENKTKFKCKNIICHFHQSFETKKWNDFVSLLNSIQSEKVHILFDTQSNGINSLVLNLLYEELIEGGWKQKNIDRLRFELNEFDDPHSISLLVDLVKRNRINEGVFVWIRKIERRREEEEKNLIKRETEELFNSINQSKTIQEFNILNLDSNFTPDFHFNRFTNFHLKKLYFHGYLNVLNENKEEKYELEDVRMTSFTEGKNLNWIQNLQGTKSVWCRLNEFKKLVKTEWPGLKVIEELNLLINKPQSVQFLNSVSELTNLQVLILDVLSIKTIPSKSELVFIHLFSSLRLRICEFLWIQNLELFSFLTEMLMEGMKKKEEDKNNFTIGSNEGKKVYLQELVIGFNKIEIEWNHLKKCNGVQRTKTMLRNQHLKQCCFVDFNGYHVIKSEELELLFPSKEKFRIFPEVGGMNSNNSLYSQFEYRWFALSDRFCIKYIKE